MSGADSAIAADEAAGQGAPDADLERRFGGLRRLYGDAAYQRMRAAKVAVVGLGGVGSWAVEALARSGVAGLTLIDFDQVAESNINRQVQALGSTVGMAKVDALCQRIADIHPGCVVTGIEDFATPDNWPALLRAPVDVLIDACDQTSAKLALAAWALHSGVPLVTVGAAGGKQRAQAVEVADLADVTHDPLLASAAPAPAQAGRAAPRPDRPDLRVLARVGGPASRVRRCLRGGRQSQLPWLWLGGHGHRQLWFGGRGRGAAPGDGCGLCCTVRVGRPQNAVLESFALHEWGR